MPRQTSLRGFLRQDILSRRSKALLPLHDERKSSLKREAGVVLPLDRRTKSSSPPPDHTEVEHKVDRNVGEQINRREEISQQKLVRFLADDRKEEQNTKHNRNTRLDELIEELNTLVKSELEVTAEQRALIRGRKSQLIEEIAKLEARDRFERVRGLKAKSAEEARLPEPIGLGEKKKLQSAKARASRAVLGLEGSGKKRKREDEGYELDGEDRLRAGVKRKELPITGHWYSRIHDYFPEPENGVDGAGAAELFLTVEQRKENRRELAEYGEMLAKTAKKGRENAAKKLKEEETKKIMQKEVKEMNGKGGRVGRF